MEHALRSSGVICGSAAQKYWGSAESATSAQNFREGFEKTTKPCNGPYFGIFCGLKQKSKNKEAVFSEMPLIEHGRYGFAIAPQTETNQPIGPRRPK